MGSMTWTGKGHDTSWGNTENWEPKSEPKDGDAIIIPGDTGILGPVAPPIKLKSVEIKRNGTLTGGKLEITEKFSFYGGNVRNDIDILDTAEMVFSDNDTKTLTGSIITNYGTIKVIGTGPILMSEGLKLINLGRTEFTSASTVKWSSGNPVEFHNKGTLALKPSLILISPVNVSLYGIGLWNYGEIITETGELRLEGSLGSAHRFFHNSRISGMFESGRVVITNGGSVSLEGELLLNPQGVLEIAGQGNLVPGTVQAGAPAPLLRNSGKLIWTGGTITAAVQVESAGSMEVTGTGEKVLSQGSIRNEGSISVKGTGAIKLGGGGTILNIGTMQFTESVPITYGYGTGGVLDHRGTIQVTGEASSHDFPLVRIKGVQFLTTGLIQLQTGQLRLEEAKATIKSGTRLEGQGRAVLASGTLTLEQDLTIDAATTFELSGSGILTTAQARKLVCAGTFAWQGGNLLTALQIQSGGLLQISGIEKKSLNIVRITNDGTIRWSGTGAVQAAAGAALTNNGLIETDGNVNMIWTSGARSAIDNAGTIRIGNGIALFNEVNFTTRGNVEIKDQSTLQFKGVCDYRQTAGETKLSGGKLQSINTIRLEGGTICGNGTIEASLRNTNATLSPGLPEQAGQIKITASYTQDSTGRMNIRLHGPTLFSQVVVAGTMTLAGRLTLDLAPGFEPLEGVKYDVFTYPSVATRFTQIIRPVYATNFTLVETYALQALGFEALSVQTMANRLLGNGGVTLAASHTSGNADQATPQHNMTQVAAGQPANCSSYCTTNSSGVTKCGPGGTTPIQPLTMAALTHLAQIYTYSVSEIAGGVHGDDSRHYVGRAFDITHINGRQVQAGHPQLNAFKSALKSFVTEDVFGPGDKDHDYHVHAEWPLN